MSLLAVVLLGGCNKTASPQGQALFTLAKTQYDNQDYSLAAHTLTEFIAREGGVRESAEAYYLRGMCYRYREPAKLELSEKDFLAAIKKSDTAILRSWSYVALGHIYFENHIDQQEPTVRYYQKALETLSNEPPKDVVLYRLGVAMQRLGQWEQADIYLSHCFDSFSDSSYARYARRHFGARTWRIQFGAFANVKRAQELVSQLNSAGRQADWQSHREEGRLLYIVRGGQYPRYIEAQADLERARGTYPDALLVAVALPKLK